MGKPSGTVAVPCSTAVRWPSAIPRVSNVTGPPKQSGECSSGGHSWLTKAIVVPSGDHAAEKNLVSASSRSSCTGEPLTGTTKRGACSTAGNGVSLSVGIKLAPGQMPALLHGRQPATTTADPSGDHEIGPISWVPSGKAR